MSDFKPGEIVDVVIKGVRVVPTDNVLPNDPRDLVAIADEHGDFWPLPPQAAVTRVAPEVRLGDLWHDAGGTLWFVIQAGFDQPLEMRCQDDSVCTPQYVATTFGPLTLVHREQGEATT